MFIPITLAGFSHSESINSFVGAFMNNTGFWYNFVFGLLIIAFTYFYTAITINPTQMAEEMKRNNGFIPGIKPGKRTAEYLDLIMSRITLPGSIFWLLLPYCLRLLRCSELIRNLHNSLVEHPC